VNYGFVYILHNEFMTVVKIGCTERSPHARAEELSKPTGVPGPFTVACYAEVRDFQGFERRLHSWLEDYRANDAREFFYDYGVSRAVALMYHCKDTLSFTVVDHAWMADALNGRSVADLADPWKPDPPTPETVTPPALRVVGGFDDGGLG
jgi:hypothetical protein